MTTDQELAQDYETLRDHIIEKLNPPDGDDAEPYIMCCAIDRAVEFIESQPCASEPGAYENYGDSCDRCWALGRREKRGWTSHEYTFMPWRM